LAKVNPSEGKIDALLTSLRDKEQLIHGPVLFDREMRAKHGAMTITTNQRMKVTPACVALETIEEGHVVTVYSDSSYLINCMRRGWHKKWRENGWLNNLQDPVANRDL
jgi:ribonuclease HI